MSFLRRLRNPKKPLVLAAALFSVCGLVFAGFMSFTSSGPQGNAAPDTSATAGSSGNPPSLPPAPPELADGSAGPHAPGPQGNYHGSSGSPHGGSSNGPLLADSPPPSGPPPTLTQGDTPVPGEAGQGGDGGGGSSVFNAEGANFAAMGGSGGGGGGGSGASGGGPGQQSRCDSLIGCTSGTPPKSDDKGGPGDMSHPNPEPDDNPLVQTTPVPEPETYAMLLAGLGVMGAVARRRKM